MKPRVAFWVFALIVTASVVTGIDSLVRTERRAEHEVNRALALTLQRCEPDRIDADTIRVYRSHIAMDGVRDTAYLSLAMADDERQQVKRTNGKGVTLKAYTGLTLRRLWALSDQRASGALAGLAAAWLALSLLIMHRQRRVFVESVRVGALSYDANRHLFYARGHEVRFTPLQQALMEQFMTSPDHLLSQQDICDRLWPKKPDASATLYTLIRRLKPTLDELGGLKITCNRGESYQLKTR